MNKTATLVPMIAGFMLMAASASQAQTAAPQSETGAYVSLAVGGQPQKRSFGSSGSFSSFNETGRYEVIQNVGAGVMFDIGGGYKFAKHLAAGLSVWSTRSKSAAAAAASIPDPLFFGRFTTVTPTAVNELKQSTLGVNVFVTYTTPVADRFDLAVSLGPSLIKTKLDVAGATVTPNSQNIALTTDSQSKTTAKAGNFSLDFTYRLTSMYSAGVFARYAGGELDLPAVRKLKVGTAQAGGLIRYRF
jgi:Outer membrane protein beta-barrel domain